MSKNVPVTKVIEHFAHDATTSRERINAGKALSAVAKLIEECDALMITPHGHVDSALQARIAAISAALGRVKGE